MTDRITTEVFRDFKVTSDISESLVQKEMSTLTAKIRGVISRSRGGMSSYIEITPFGREIINLHKDMGIGADKALRTIDATQDKKTKQLITFELTRRDDPGVSKTQRFSANFELQQNGDPIILKLPGTPDFSTLRPKEKLNRLDLFKKELDLIN